MLGLVSLVWLLPLAGAQSGPLDCSFNEGTLCNWENAPSGEEVGHPFAISD